VLKRERSGKMIGAVIGVASGFALGFILGKTRHQASYTCPCMQSFSRMQHGLRGIDFGRYRALNSTTIMIQPQVKSKIVKVKKKSSASKPTPQEAAFTRPTEEFKMVLCVNEALKMGKGKIGAQCAHAALGVAQQYRARHELSFKHWERHGQAKIALKINDDHEMVGVSFCMVDKDYEHCLFTLSG
jgi:hypothetical protein